MKSIFGAAFWFAALAATPSYAFFIDGDGHYALRGETETKPSFSEETGTYQAIEQSFRLRGEARFNDLSGMFLEFRLFDKPKDAYLGDKAEAKPCVDDPSKECRNQDTSEPRYEPYLPYVTKAYMRYAFDYCIVEAGRRGRQWGLGIFLDEGNKPFDRDASTFDGITCKVNIQKTQTLGFSLGYDKLSETGDYVDPDARPLPGNEGRQFGANDVGDDIDQYFFTIEYDDRKANAGSNFTKQVGVYFAQISSKNIEDGGSETDLKFLDLYTGFYFSDLALRNEILFRMGKSADPNFQSLGGQGLDNGAIVKNKLDSIALAGTLEWTMSRQGAVLGPAEYNEGTASRHVLFLNYAYAPGDQDAYLDANTPADAEVKRDNKVEAMALHRNYKPALILFNGRPEAEAFNVGGAFSATRVVNASVFSLGYKYESQTIGDFETKFITAYLNEGINGETKKLFEAQDAADPNEDGRRPAGYYGSNLGLELDFAYTYHAGRDAAVGMALGAALPGKAWQVQEDRKPVTDFLVQSFLAFYF